MTIGKRCNLWLKFAVGHTTGPEHGYVTLVIASAD